jgi:Zn-dependent M16 (insulinase) family peptidase
LKKRFVEIDEPLATSVYMYSVENWEPAIVVGFSQVPVKKMDQIEEEFQDAIHEILDAGPDKFDVERIGTIVDKMMLARQVKIENGPQEVIPGAIVADMLYSTKKTDLHTFLKQGDLETAQNMKDKSGQFWLDLLRETLCRCNDNPRVKLLAYPNANYNKELVANETKRVEKQQEILGEEGMKKAAEDVKNALASTKLPPKSVLLKVPFADVNSMTYHTLHYYNHTTPKQPKGFDLKSIPFRFEIDDINSEFVRIYTFLDTSEIAVEDQMYLSLLSNLWLQCPLKKSDGTIISFEEVTKQREKDALSFSNYIGGSQSQFVRFIARLKVEKYEDVIKLLQDALYDVDFSVERAKTRIARVLNSIPHAKQDAGTIVGAVYNNIYFNNQTYLHASSFLRQKQFLEKVKEELDTKPESLINKLQELRQTIVKSKNTYVYIATNLTQLVDAHGDMASKVWTNFFRGEKQEDRVPEENMSQRYHITQELVYRDPSPKMRHAIVGLPGTESCYMKQAIDFDMSNWESKELAAVRLMLQYLTNIMYDQIRGQGWTYGIWAGVSVTAGRMGVSFVKSSDLVPAYKEFRKIIANYSEDPDIWDPVKLDSARGTLIYSWIATEETPANLASASVSSYLRGQDDPFYARRFVKMLSDVTVDDVQKAAKKYLHGFFYPKQTYSSVVCSPKDIKIVKEMLNEYKFDLTEIDDLENSILTEP